MKIDTMSIKRENATIAINTFKEKFHPPFEYDSKSGNLKILVLDKYDFFRTNSNLAVTLLFDLESVDVCNIKIIVAGGGRGMLQFDMGAENSLLNKIKKFFEKYGYEDQLKKA
ncbi:MAG: DUF6054 family protein [Candidatus Freyarchaeum deiterrae]